MKLFLKRYSHAGIFIIFSMIYIPWFMFLEHTVQNSYHIIHMAVDDIIPFNEYFIVPYLLWFFYVAGTILYFVFTDKSEYKKLCIFLITGMTIFLLVSTFYPNGDTLRPSVFPRNNLFTRLVIHLYRSDTATNIFPSIHVYNSLGCYFALSNSEKLSKNRPLMVTSFILTLSIILSTMFLKQHSVFDVITAFILATVMYFFAYVIDYSIAAERIAVLKRRKRRYLDRNQA